MLGPGVDAGDVRGGEEGAEISHPRLKIPEVAIRLSQTGCGPFALGIRHPADGFKGFVLRAALGDGPQDRLNAVQLANGIEVADDGRGSSKDAEHGIARLLAARTLEARRADLGELRVDGLGDGQPCTFLLDGAKLANGIWGILSQEAKDSKGVSGGGSNFADRGQLTRDVGKVGKEIVLLGALIAAGTIVLVSGGAVFLSCAFVTDGSDRLQVGQINKRTFEILVGLMAHRAIGHIVVRAFHAFNAECGQLAEGLGLCERSWMDAWETFRRTCSADMGDELLGQVVARHVLKQSKQGVFDRNLASKRRALAIITPFGTNQEGRAPFSFLNARADDSALAALT